MIFILTALLLWVGADGFPQQASVSKVSNWKPSSPSPQKPEWNNAWHIESEQPSDGGLTSGHNFRTLPLQDMATNTSSLTPRRKRSNVSGQSNCSWQDMISKYLNCTGTGSCEPVFIMIPSCFPPQNSSSVNSTDSSNSTTPSSPKESSNATTPSSPKESSNSTTPSSPKESSNATTPSPTEESSNATTPDTPTDANNATSTNPANNTGASVNSTGSSPTANASNASNSSNVSNASNASNSSNVSNASNASNPSNTTCVCICPNSTSCCSSSKNFEDTMQKFIQAMTDFTRTGTVNNYITIKVPNSGSVGCDVRDRNCDERE